MKTILQFNIIAFLLFLGVGGIKEEMPIKLDLLICELTQNHRLTEQQLQMLVPFEKGNKRYLIQGKIFNDKYVINYVKEKSWLDELGNVQKPIYFEQEIARNHLKEIDLNALKSEKAISVDYIKRSITSYDFVLGFSTKQTKNLSTYTFRIFTNVKDLISYITDSILVENPDAKILVVYNPPINGSGKQPEQKELFPPEKISTTNTGKTATLSYSGGNGKVFKWYSGRCGGTLVGQGNNLEVTPTKTTIYYGRWEDGDKVSECQQITVIVKEGPPPPPPPSGITYSFGKYTGEIKYSSDLRKEIPEGDGKMTYTRRVQIAKHDTNSPAHYAEAGDYFDGSWGNGDIVSGALYDKNGQIKERILAPKRFNPYDLSKD